MGVVQHTSTFFGVTTDGGLAFSSNVTAGNTILYAVRFGSTGDTYTISDGLNGTYAQDKVQTLATDGDTLIIGSLSNVKGGATTLTFSCVTGTKVAAAIVEVSGVYVIDKTASANATSTSASSGNTATTTAADELIFSAVATDNNSAETIAATGGNTALDTVTDSGSSFDILADAYRFVSATGQYAGTFSLTTSEEWACAVATYKSSISPVLVWNGDSGFTSAGVSQKSVARNSNVSAGDLFVVCVLGNQDNNVTSVVDGQIGTLGPLGGNTAIWDATSNVWMQFFAAHSVSSYTGSAGNNITVNFSSSTGYAEVIGMQFSPLPGWAIGAFGASVANGPQTPGAGGTITTGNTTISSVPFFFVAASDFASGTGGVGQTVSNGWTSSFTASSGGFVPSWAVENSTGGYNGAWTVPAGGGTAVYDAILAGWYMYQLAPFNSPPELASTPARVKRPWLADSYSSSLDLLTIPQASLPFISPDMSVPRRRAVTNAVVTQGEQQSQVTNILFGKDAVLVPTSWTYKWKSSLERMPMALRSDLYGTPPVALFAGTQYPTGSTEFSFVGRRVLQKIYGYEFSMPLPIYGKDQAYGAAGQPILNVDYPVPAERRRASSLSSDFAPALEALFTFTPTSPPIAQYDWPVPKAPRRVVQDWTQGLLDTQLTFLTTFPFNQLNWPNPIGYLYPVSLREFELGPNLAALQQYSYPPPQQTFSPDWPNPLVAKRSIDLLGFELFNIAIFATIPTKGGHVGRIIFPSKRLSDVADCPFDFISALQPGETIVSAVVTASVYSGIDADAAAILDAAPVCIGTVATQYITAGSSQVGNIYILLCKATSNLGKLYTMAGYLAVEPDVP